MAILAKFCEAMTVSSTIINDGTSSKAGLHGLDATETQAATNRPTLGPVSPSSGPNHTADNKATTKESEEVDAIDKLLGRAEGLETQLAR